jgi:hypothetical protein
LIVLLTSVTSSWLIYFWSIEALLALPSALRTAAAVGSPCDAFCTDAVGWLADDMFEGELAFEAAVAEEVSEAENSLCPTTALLWFGKWSVISFCRCCSLGIL